jgi:hypothetical protein
MKKSAASPVTLSMPDKDIKPVRIDHKGIEIPDPTPKLLNAMALKGWLDYSANMEQVLDHQLPAWDDLPIELKDVWYRIARGQHAILSLLAGSSVSVIDAD